MALRLGLVGRGRWGRNIERTLLSLPDVSLKVIARGQQPSQDLDGVLIATPSTSHADVALPYIANGIATFIEKPMATSVADAERIRETATRSGAGVFVGHIHLHNPAFQALLNVLPMLGAVRYVLGEGMNSDVRTDPSVLWDWLPHDLSMARAIFGKDPVSAAGWRLWGSPKTEAAVTKFMFGDVALLSTVSWHSPTKHKRLTISAEKGTIVFDDKAQRKLAVYATDGAISYPEYDEELPLTREMHSFLEMIRLGAADRSHIDLGVAIVRMIAAAEGSIANAGAPVSI